MASGCEEDPRYAGLEERKRKRMISNRESARRSRMRKQQLLGDLTSQVIQLQNENGAIAEKINDVAYNFIGMESRNNVLRAQIAELADRLRRLNSVLKIAGVVGGLAVEIPEIPETLLEPWQLPCPAQP